MDAFKQFLKGVLHKFNDKRENTYPSIRMSEIDTSIISDNVTPHLCSTLKLPENEKINVKHENDSLIDITNNLNTTKSSRTKMNNLIIPKNNCTSSPESKQDNKNKLPKLNIINNKELNNAVVNLSKEQSIINKNICKPVQMESSPDTPKYNKPIMGRIALLKRANVERNDSVIIHELITDRYNPALNHCYSRMYRRRRSKIDSSEDEYSDTVFSSPPNSSPMSFSSIETSNSQTVDARNGFHFPRPAKEPKDLRFLQSTDDVNIDTTVEDLDASSLNSSAISNDKSTTSFSEYDPKKFLENAIGEVTIVSSESGIINDELEPKRTGRKMENSSVGPSDVSSLLSKVSGVHGSVNETVKRNSMKVQGTPQNEDQSKDYRQSVVSDNSLLDNLMMELSIQNKILFQVSKALNYCRTMKGFETTVEFIEAEKILLVASCTKSALSKEIENVEDDTYEKKEDPKSCGQVNLCNFRFFPKDELGMQELTDQFVAVLTCGSTVLASDVITANEDGAIHIEKNFEFKNLATDFEISVYMYSMRHHNKSQHSREQRNCPSAKKFFLNKVSRKYKVRNESLYISPSSFLLWGKCEIRSPDLLKLKSNTDTVPCITLKMHSIPLNSSLSGIFSVDINSNVKLNNKISGFLTIGLDNDHGCIIWNVRWCVLQGTTLKYWNHPSEEDTNVLGSLDLTNCLEHQICAVDRSLCARPRTLMVPVKYKESERKYLLSADKLCDMKQWEEELNYVLHVLSIWNCGTKVS